MRKGLFSVPPHVCPAAHQASLPPPQPEQLSSPLPLLSLGSHLSKDPKAREGTSANETETSAHRIVSPSQHSHGSLRQSIAMNIVLSETSRHLQSGAESTFLWLLDAPAGGRGLDDDSTVSSTAFPSEESVFAQIVCHLASALSASTAVHVGQISSATDRLSRGLQRVAFVQLVQPSDNSVARSANHRSPNSDSSRQCVAAIHECLAYVNAGAHRKLGCILHRHGLALKGAIHPAGQRFANLISLKHFDAVVLL